MQYWGDGYPPPGLVKRMKTCETNNPSLKYKFINSGGAAKRLNRWYGSDIANSFLAIRMEAMRSDVFRVAWVLQKGGFYVDAASVVLGPLSEWVTQGKLTLIKKPHMIKSESVWNGFIYAPTPSHPFLQELWSRQKRVLLTRECKEIWKETGPGLFRDVLKDSAPSMMSSISILTTDKFDKFFRFSSSSAFIDTNQHWSKRQARGENLFY